MKAAIRWMGFVTPIALFAVSAFAAIPNQNCVDCQVRATEQAQPSSLSQRVQLSETFDVLAKAASREAAAPNTTPAPAAAENAEVSQAGSVVYNEFQTPWTFGKTNFDASFRTPYWSPSTGFLNDVTAPWNQGVTAEYGTQLFNAGMSYVGPLSMAPLAPIFL